MKMKLFLFVSVMAVIVFAGLACSHPSTKSVAGQSTYYTCPMHPSVREDKPGACPICGMNLVAVQAAVPASTNAAPAVSTNNP
jgi:Cu(I)/Ag(I) efflux system membrane fusion protein